MAGKALWEVLDTVVMKYDDIDMDLFESEIEEKMEKSKYNELVKNKTPNSPIFKNCFFGESKINQEQNTQMTPYEESTIKIYE